MPRTVLTCGVSVTDYAEIAPRQQDLESCFPVRNDLSFDDARSVSISGVQTALKPTLHQLWFSYDHEDRTPRASLLACADPALGSRFAVARAEAENYYYNWNLFFFDLKAHR
jgi:hypothetical protein